MRRVTATGRFLLVVAALGSCGAPGREPRTAAISPPRAAESRPADRPAPARGVRVEIIQAGQAPRRALRYRLQPDRLGVMSTFFDMDLGYKSGDGSMIYTPSPPMEMDMELTGMTVEGGVARMSDRITRLDVVTSPSDTTDEKTRAAVRERLQGMVGMTGVMAMDDLGHLKEMTWTIPDTVAPEIRAMLESMSQSADDMVIPLPEEPVGLGAEWYSVKEVPLMGMKVASTSRVKLVAIDGDRITLRSSTEMSAGAQPVALPGLPAGTTAELLSCDGGGGAEVDLDLGWVAPLRMSVQSHTELAMELTSGGSKERITVLARITMETRRR
jgi:hypothetical protein